MAEKINENELLTNKDNITNKDKKSIKDDIMFFKEEILKHMSSLEKSFETQKEEIRSKINGKFILYDETLTKLNNNFNELKKKVEMNDYIKEQMDILDNFKNDIKKSTAEDNIKLVMLEKDVNNNFYRIDKLLNSSIIYPRIIGFNSKFKTFHEYIDYTLNQITSFDMFKNKMEMDLNSFKSKIDKMIQSLKYKIECSISDSHQIVKNGVKENELILKEYINGKIFDLQLKDTELEQKINKYLQDITENLNSYQEKMKLFDEKIEEKMNLNSFYEEKISVYKSIEENKKEEEEIIKRINILEKYKETQEKNLLQSKSLERKIFRNYSGLNIYPGNNQEFDLLDLNEGGKITNNENVLNQEINETNVQSQNLEGNNIINSENENKNNKGNNTNIINSPNLNNENNIKLYKENFQKNSLTSQENTIINNNISKYPKSIEKPKRSLYKLRISLQDINAQFNLRNIPDNNDSKNISKDLFIIHNHPLTLPINNDLTTFNRILSYSYRNQLKNMLESRTIIKPLFIHKKGIKYLYDDIDIKNLKNSNKKKINTEEVHQKNKTKKLGDKKKIWERLLSQKKNRKSTTNILNNYLMNYRSHNAFKTGNKMHLSRSSQNFFDKFFKG